MKASRILMAAALVAAGASAWALPQVKTTGDVQYMTGGIGEDESTAMLEQSHHWPLTLEFARKAGKGAEWMANVGVTVTDHRGDPVLQATSDGPLLLARLAPGNYTVRASAGGQVIERHVHVTPGHPGKAVLVWPQGTSVATR